MEGCVGRIRLHMPISCTVNPAAGNERELAITEAEERKSVLVVGGGPGGMEAARVSALRGHEVTLWERGDRLGGHLITASACGCKSDYRLLAEYLIAQVRKVGVKVELGKEATVEAIVEFAPDVVFLAGGGSGAIVPDIPGVERAVMAIDVLLGREEVGESVVVIGGGLIGSEVALYLAEGGKRVTIVEIMGAIIRDMVSINRAHFLKLLADNGVEVLTDTEVMEVMGGGVTISGKDGKGGEVRADTVVLAIGLKSEDKLSVALTDRVSQVYLIGDVVKPRKVINAMWEGYRKARLV
jgi:2-enoate reductase